MVVSVLLNWIRQLIQQISANSLKISLRLGISNTTDTQNYIKKLIKDATPESQKTLSTCLSSYVAATTSFKSALSELSEDPLSANYDSRVAGDDVQECEDELARDKARISWTYNQKQLRKAL
ncbi:hypothetical protein OIU84_018106 [Salix udensis]|uniref:Pectinesterase inhibitor domain-containing protein n=1 Tax=Salix udensis TaxID=889485 RepID=A0AAD6L507_9ROSI|nr:hypothetical protein OIU84_018106 [Salix udensis]